MEIAAADKHFHLENHSESIKHNGKIREDTDEKNETLVNIDNDQIQIDNYSDLLIVDLPEVALVNVMEYLNLRERYYLSLTCRLFYHLFTHPSLWQIAHIDLICSGKNESKDYSRWKLNYIMRSTMVEIIKRFSHTFQHLSLNMNSNIQRFDDVSAMLLEELRCKSRLESLTLKLGPLTSDDRDIRRVMSIRSDPRDVPIVVGLIQSSVRLKRLNIISWPLFTEMKDNNLMLAIQSNEKLKTLESLSLFFIDVKKVAWTERIPKLPCVGQTLDVISFLSHLTHLALRSPMISDETILLLAAPKRRRLEHFQILVTFANPSSLHNGFSIPEIKSSSWKKLTEVSPSLRVEFFILTRVPWDQLQILFKPEVPLSSLSLMNYSHCNNVLIDCIASHYESTLKTFISLCDSSYCDEALKRMVNGCVHLKNLAYHGDINYKTVMEIAHLTKDEENKWDLFQFKKNNIKTNYEEEEDEDEVVKYDEVNQIYYLGGVNAWHIDEDRHQKKLDEMVEHVRKSFGTATNLFFVNLNIESMYL